MGLPSGIKESDFAYSCEAKGHVWDVYHFHTPVGDPGTLAFCKVEGSDRWIVGVLCREHLQEVEVVQQIEDAEDVKQA